MDVFGVHLLNPETLGVFIHLHRHQQLHHLLHRAMSAILISVTVAMLAPTSQLALLLVAVGNQLIQAHPYPGVTFPNKT